MNCRIVLVLYLVHSSSSQLRNCSPDKYFIRYFKIKSCHKSTAVTTSWTNVNSVNECMKFARNRNALAFNFSPPNLNNITLSYWERNCQVLGCPEIVNSSTLVFDPLFDYYSAYGDSNATIDSTCIQSIGLFEIIREKLNYTDAVNFCQNSGGDLADITSEVRSNSLAALLSSLPGWYKAAYVGLEDTNVEGTFETPIGTTLSCSNYRAWAVGHPRRGRLNEDCVILGVENVWRAINCKIMMGFICEYYPASPQQLAMELKLQNCSYFTNESKKKHCTANNELYELYRNLSRVDQCVLINATD